MWYSSFYNDFLDQTYVSLGVQYFLLARYGTQFPFTPVSGSLYHLGFELLLKSYLVKNGFTATELADTKKWGHKLNKLWKEFKNKVNDERLDDFDLIVKNLDAWERVRYIALKEGKHASQIAITKGHADCSYLDEIKHIDFNNQNNFLLHTDDMDELFFIFFTTLKIPPEELLKVPDFVWGKNIYEKDNKFNILTYSHLSNQR